MSPTDTESTELPERLLVVGTGVVGARVSRLLEATPHRVRSAAAVLAPVGVLPRVAIITTGGSHAPLAAELGRRGVSVVSVADGLNDIGELLELDGLFADHEATLVVGAAMSPGISGLLARRLADSLESCDEIHTAFHATAGPACARQHHEALAGWAVGWHDGEWTERPGGSGRELCWFPEPVGARDCYRAALADPLLLHRDLDDVNRISARISATRRDRLTARLPMLRPPHPEGGIGAVRVEVRGRDADGVRQTLIAGIAEFVGAAAAATAVAMTRQVLAGQAPRGVLSTSDRRLDTDTVLEEVQRNGIRLQEFTGVPQQA
jgi:hypothetical protein